MLIKFFKLNFLKNAAGRHFFFFYKCVHCCQVFPLKKFSVESVVNVHNLKIFTFAFFSEKSWTGRVVEVGIIRKSWIFWQSLALLSRKWLLLTSLMIKDWRSSTNTSRLAVMLKGKHIVPTRTWHHNGKRLWRYLEKALLLESSGPTPIKLYGLRSSRIIEIIIPQKNIWFHSQIPTITSWCCSLWTVCQTTSI